MKKISIVDKLLMLFTLATGEQINKHCRNSLVILSIVLAVPIVIPAVSAAAPGNANVILAFDDGWNSVLDNAKPIMDSNGQKGVEFIITIQPDLAWNGLPDNYMNRAQLSQLYNAGWDLSSHSMTHGGYGAYCFVESTNTPCNENYLSLANNSQLEYELGQSKAWLDNNGYKNGSMFFAYPYGYYDAGLVNQIKAAGYYVAARTVDAYSWRYPTPEKPMKHPNYKIGDSDVLEMATYMVAGVTDVNDNVTTPQMIMDEINSTVSENGLLVLTFHKIVNGTPTVSEEYNKADFAKISGYLKTLQNSGKVKVVTMSEYFGVPDPIPTYMPGTPLIAAKIIGKDWINVTWNAAPGNKTDVYDLSVNNNIIYNVVNKSINVTGLSPGSSVKIDVYAINRSWGWTTKNDTPLEINETLVENSIPVTYMPPIPINTTGTNGTNGTNVSWIAGNGNKTDYFNYSVNGIWHNNSLDTSYNASGINGTIEVYAVNSTNGTTLNNTPLVINFSNAILLTTTYEPSTPNNITSIIGSDYITTKWEPGNGNLTDVYNININGTWFNGSKENFVNVTNLSAGNYTLVSVYAVNNTNGTTVNNIPAILNSSIPLANTTPTPVVTPPRSGGGGSGGSSSSGSSGSGGGGGGGSFFDPNAEFFERQDTDIHNGTVSTIVFTKNGLVTEVTLNGTKNYGEATAVVSLLKKNPSKVSIDGAVVYKYFSVNIGTIKHENEKLFFKDPTVTIYLNNTNIGDKIVKVYMFKNGSWIPVSTEITEKTATKTYFKSKLDGFANFAVAFEPKQDVQQDVQHGTDMNTQRANLSENTGPQEQKPVSTSTPSVPNPNKAPGFEILIAIVVLYVAYKKIR